MNDDFPSPDWHEIITQLCLEAGRIMEDTTDALASALPHDPDAFADHLRQLRTEADDVQALIAAAQALQRRCPLQET